MLHGHLGREATRAKPVLSAAKECPCHGKLSRCFIIGAVSRRTAVCPRHGPVGWNHPWCPA